MIRILALADTHLGFDYPFRPRINRRRRGPDFFDNFDRALEPALKGQVDLVVHGGDIFFRSRIPGMLVDMVFTLFHRIADKGIPVYIVPGNHERSTIPYRLFAEHPNIFIFDEPTCYLFNKEGFTLGLVGFPSVRKDIRVKFPEILKQTKWQEMQADGYILCMHQSVDGATTGPDHYTFRYSGDVVDVNDIPSSFMTVLTGHMHRHQCIQCDLKGRPLSHPIFYPGSVEHISFAEKNEKKGYMTIDIHARRKERGEIHRWQFNELPARPMVELIFDTSNAESHVFESWLKDRMSTISEDAIIRIKLLGQPNEGLLEMIRAKSLRSMVPDSMNIGVKWVDGRP